MTINQSVAQAFLKAMKEKDTRRLDTFRMLKAALKNKAIELRQPELADADALAVIKSEVKKRLEAAEVYIQGGRAELADKEKQEVEILNVFLPPQMADADVEEKAREAIGQLPEAEQKNFGKAMAAVMAQLKGQADGQLVSRAVKKILAE